MRTPTDDLQGSLRSVELGTPSLPPLWECDFEQWRKLSDREKQRLQAAAEDSRRSLVDTISDRRAKMLIAAGKLPDTVVEKVAGQRFIVYLPETNLADGAAALVTHGYFDDDNVPPWDTWLMYFPAHHRQPGKLISWVPPQFTQLVDCGIQVNPEECIYWATEELLFPCKKRSNKLSCFSYLVGRFFRDC
jgi:hypothetical protein